MIFETESDGRKFKHLQFEEIPDDPEPILFGFGKQP